MPVRKRRTSPLARDVAVRRTLLDDVGALGLSLSERQIDQFLSYLEMLLKWNATARLTAITPPIDIVRLHFVDSLLVLRADIALRAQLVDVGSGAGFPGIPLKIVRPDLTVTLLESAGRKAAFLELVAAELKLGVRVLKCRAESAGHDGEWRETFDVAAARAVAPLAALCELTLPLIRIGGSAILLKGPAVWGELSSARRAVALLGGGTPVVFEDRLPGGERRVVVRISKASPTPAAYPRRAGVPARKPVG